MRGNPAREHVLECRCRSPAALLACFRRVRDRGARLDRTHEVTWRLFVAVDERLLHRHVLI